MALCSASSVKVLDLMKKVNYKLRVGIFVSYFIYWTLKKDLTKYSLYDCFTGHLQ